MPPTWPWQKSSAHHQETLDRPSTSLAESLLLGPKPWPLGEAGPPGAKPLGPLHPSRCSGLQQTLAARERAGNAGKPLHLDRDEQTERGRQSFAAGLPAWCCPFPGAASPALGCLRGTSSSVAVLRSPEDLCFDFQYFLPNWFLGDCSRRHYQA